MGRKELEKAYNIMRRRYESMINANDAISTELTKAFERIKFLEKLIEERDNKAEINKLMLQELADNQNSQKDSMAKEIRILKDKIKELEDGDLN